MEATRHFTYVSEPETDRLCQGDLIKRTSEVEGLLKDVHPHFFGKGDYRHFLVLTQSCDLLRRNDQACASPYITLAAVRPLRIAIEREAKRIQFNAIEEKLQVLDLGRKERLVQFVERLLNNNEDRYFFLCKEASFGFIEDQCAFLQLSIPLKSRQHYDTLLSAKVLQLTESFQHKLGYLVGKLYSRVGTEDWLPDNYTLEEFKKASRKPVDDLDSIIWLDPVIHGKAMRQMKDLPIEEVTNERFGEIINEIGKIRSKKRRQVLEAVESILTNLGIDESSATKALDRLANDPDFTDAIR